MRQDTAGQPGHRLAPNLATAAVATTVATGLMFWSRQAFQIRTLPERAMEWVLLFVPPESFEAAVGRFGSQAKVYALYVAVAGMALLLLALGTSVLQLARSPWAVWATAPFLYLVAMGAVMPITGGGLLGSELFQDPWLVNACYLGTACAYATVLLLGRAGLASRVPGRFGAERGVPPRGALARTSRRREQPAAGESGIHRRAYPAAEPDAGADRPGPAAGDHGGGRRPGDRGTRRG